ncbi:MAG: oligosaccharide flippase family protein, partial [Clostridia bacterium]|nr:oligosaccharide flippase family protein [Clostridia bacterium]
MKGSFVKSATLMMVALLLSKIIGACYRIPLTNILGAEGMGLYQMVYPVYAVALTASSGALPLAISVLVSENNAKGNLKGNLTLIRASFVIVVGTGVILAVLLAVGGGLIGRLQGAQSARIGYIAIAPAIVFVSGIAVLKGWFQGHEQMFPTALSSLVESVVKLAVGLSLAYVLRAYGVAVQVGGALIGVSVSEAVTFVILYFIYKRKNLGDRVKLDFNLAKEEYKSILRISLPITIGGMIFPLTQFIDSFLVVNVLKGSLGESVATA